MTMGAKNMTMTEVQTGRRIGSCPRYVAELIPKKLFCAAGPT